MNEQDELIPQAAEPRAPYGTGESGDFASMILEQLRGTGVQQARKKDRIEFSSLEPWPGRFIAAEGRWSEGEGGRERRAGILIGPEFGTVSRPDLVEAAREAAEADFDALVSCAFAYDAHAAELPKLGRLPILKARMNADLHMAADLKNTGKGNLFVVFGEPDSRSSRPGRTRRETCCRPASSAWMCSTPRPATSAARARKGSPAGSSTPTTTAKASSSATPTSPAR